MVYGLNIVSAYIHNMVAKVFMLSCVADFFKNIYIALYVDNLSCPGDNN